MYKIARYPVFLLAVSASPACLAYVGPGLGAGVLGVIIGLVASVLIALFSIIWFPLKRLFTHKKKQSDATDWKSEDDEE